MRGVPEAGDSAGKGDILFDGCLKYAESPKRETPLRRASNTRKAF
jgi:hypothetical protein